MYPPLFLWFFSWCVPNSLRSLLCERWIIYIFSAITQILIPMLPNDIEAHRILLQHRSTSASRVKTSVENMRKEVPIEQLRSAKRADWGYTYWYILNASLRYCYCLPLSSFLHEAQWARLKRQRITNHSRHQLWNPKCVHNTSTLVHTFMKKIW